MIYVLIIFNVNIIGSEIVYIYLIDFVFNVFIRIKIKIILYQDHELHIIRVHYVFQSP